MTALATLHQPAPFGGDRAPAMMLPMPMPKTPAKTFRDVELVRAFLDKGHPWLAILALAFRTGVIGTAIVLVLGIARMVIERFL